METNTRSQSLSDKNKYGNELPSEEGNFVGHSVEEDQVGSYPKTNNNNFYVSTSEHTPITVRGMQVPVVVIEIEQWHVLRPQKIKVLEKMAYSDDVLDVTQLDLRGLNVQIVSRKVEQYFKHDKTQISMDGLIDLVESIGKKAPNLREVNFRYLEVGFLSIQLSTVEEISIESLSLDALSNVLTLDLIKCPRLKKVTIDALGHCSENGAEIKVNPDVQVSTSDVILMRLMKLGEEGRSKETSFDMSMISPKELVENGRFSLIAKQLPNLKELCLGEFKLEERIEPWLLLGELARFKQVEIIRIKSLVSNSIELTKDGGTFLPNLKEFYVNYVENRMVNLENDKKIKVCIDTLKLSTRRAYEEYWSYYNVESKQCYFSNIEIRELDISEYHLTTEAVGELRFGFADFFSKLNKAESIKVLKLGTLSIKGKQDLAKLQGLEKLEIKELRVLGSENDCGSLDLSLNKNLKEVTVGGGQTALEHLLLAKDSGVVVRGTVRT